ncbi:hypothetical protein BHM03_00036404 [Ensete ventricosum]|nr:hypothetical protein BHM03_00036404 [Ensete ventricosum]
MLNFYGSKRTLILQGGGLHICYASPLFSLSLCSYASSCLATFPVGVKLSFTAEDKLVRTRYQATECTMVIDDLAICPMTLVPRRPRRAAPSESSCIVHTFSSPKGEREGWKAFVTAKPPPPLPRSMDVVVTHARASL